MAVAVVIVPPERTPDELIMANAIAHGLLGAGIGVMRLEVDRGASVAEIAARALAAVASVRAQSDVDTRRIGIVGIGTAGVAVPLAAERDGTAAFLVNVSTSLVGSPDPLAVWAKLRVPSLLVFRSSDANHVPITESLERLVEQRCEKQSRYEYSATRRTRRRQ